MVVSKRIKVLSKNKNYYHSNNEDKKNKNINKSNKNKNKTVINNSSNTTLTSKIIKPIDKNKDKNTCKTYIFLDKFLYSHFDFPEYAKQIKDLGFIITKDSKKAKIILSSYLSSLRKYYNRYDSYKLLLWTHEPYHDFHDKKVVIDQGQQINIMNVYTGDIFTNNYRYFHYHQPLSLLDAKAFQMDSKKIRVCALSTKYGANYYQGNKYTLLPKRYEIIDWGLKRGVLDVYGKGWQGQELGNSRNARDKETEKSKILQGYYFNLAIENTDFPNYITEKIWEPITCYNLPIYYSNATIYQDFPKGSFIDYREFQHYPNPPEKLFEFIQNISSSEFVHRMNLCITTFNNIVKKRPNKLLKCPTNPNLSKVDYSNCFQPFIQKLQKLSK